MKRLVTRFKSLPMPVFRRQWLIYGVVTLLAYAVFLVATLPAGWGALLMARTSHGRIQISQPQGTVWCGSGALVVHLAPSPPRALGSVRWRLNPLWLVTGGIGIHVEMDGGRKPSVLNARLSRNRWLLRDSEVELPAETFAQLYEPVAVLQPRGIMHISTQRFDLGVETISGEMILRWEDLGMALSQVRPLGSFVLKANGTGKDAVLTLVSERGPLVVDARGRWELGPGSLFLTGSARAAEGNPDLASLLNWIGADAGDGRRAFRTQLPLRNPLARAVSTLPADQ